MSFQGLVGCTDRMNSPPCIEKAVQVSLSSVLLLAIIVPMVLRLRYERQINLYMIIKALMSLSLVFNILYCILHNIEQFYMLESLFFNCYFPVLVYKFALKLIKKDIHYDGRFAKLVNICLTIYIMLVIIIFVYRNLRSNFTCQEIPFLVMNVMSVSLSVWLVLFGIKHTRFQQKRKIIESAVVPDNNPISNPLPQMWKCIVINIISNAVAMLRTVYFMATPQMNCHFSQVISQKHRKNQIEEQLINFVLLITTFYMGMIATLFFFGQKEKSHIPWGTSVRKNSEEGKVQLIEATNFQKDTINV